MANGKGRLLGSLRRLTANKQNIDAKNKLQNVQDKGLGALFDSPNPNPKTMDTEWKNYLSDIRKSNDQILAELMKQRNGNDKY